MRLLALFLFVAALLGWIFAMDSEARYQCAKEANDILAVMAFSPGVLMEVQEVNGDMQFRFDGDDRLVFTYQARCREMNKPN